MHWLTLRTTYILGSDSGTLDRVVASDTRGPLFESSRRQNLLQNIVYCWKDETKLKNVNVGL